MLKIFSGKKAMITCAIVLSKGSTTKRFKLGCLCYWQVDFPYGKLMEI